MAIAAVGFGGTNSTGVYQSLSTLISEFSPELVSTALQLSSPLLDSSALEQVKQNGEELVITVVQPSISSIGWVRDGAKTPIGVSAVPVKGRVQPAYISGVVKMGRGAAALAKLADDKLTSYFTQQTMQAAKQLGRTVGRSLFGGTVSPRATAAWTGTAADSTVTLNFEDVSMFSPGMAVDFLDLSATKSYAVAVKTVTYAAFTSSANVAGTVVFENVVADPVTGVPPTITDAGAVTVATTDTFRIRGELTGATTSSGSATATDAGTRPNSFDDIAGSGASTTAVHGIAVTQPGWVGQFAAVASAYNSEVVLGFMGRVAALSGEEVTDVIMAPQVAMAHAASAGVHGAAFGQSNTVGGAGRIQLDGSMDKYKSLKGGSGLTIAGKPILLDQNCQSNTLVLQNRDHCKLGVWMDIGPADEAGNPLLLGRDAFDVTYQLQGGLNLYTDLRSSIGVMNGFTGL